MSCAGPRVVREVTGLRHIWAMTEPFWEGWKTMIWAMCIFLKMLERVTLGLLLLFVVRSYTPSSVDDSFFFGDL